MKSIGLAMTVAASLCLGGACDKDKGVATKSSGALKDSEKGLMAYLSGDANVYFGGDYAKIMKNWEKSPLKKLSEGAMKAFGGGADMGNYMDCFVKAGATSSAAGAVNVTGDQFAMTMIFSGITAADFKKCSEEGGFQAKLADDGKYLSLEGIPDGMGGKTSIGYLFPEKDKAYFSMEMKTGGFGTKPKPLDRPALEASLKAAQANPASKSSSATAIISKADRSRGFWAAGTAKGTPAAEQVKEGTVWFDLTDSAIEFGFAFELTDPAMAKKAVEGYGQLKSQLPMIEAMLGPEKGAPVKKAVETIISDSKLKSDGGKLMGKFKIRNSAIEELAPLASMAGMGL